VAYINFLSNTSYLKFEVFFVFVCTVYAWMMVNGAVIFLRAYHHVHPCKKLIMVLFQLRKVSCYNSLSSGCFRGFSKKKALKRTWLCARISPLLFGLRTWSKCQKMRQVFQSALGKNFFACGVRKWRTFRPPWPTLPGPGRQPLGGSISLKFILETRLQSESFDTLDDLLGFRVQKL